MENTNAIKWEKLKTDAASEWMHRFPVPGGWILKGQLMANTYSITFVPDPEHKWDGGSLNI